MVRLHKINFGIGPLFPDLNRSPPIYVLTFKKSEFAKILMIQSQLVNL